MRLDPDPAPHRLHEKDPTLIDVLRGPLHVNMWRTYDPRVGQYLTPEPVMVEGIGAGLHPYMYANAAPATLTDPDGRFISSCQTPAGLLLCGGAGSFGGAAAGAAEGAGVGVGTGAGVGAADILGPVIGACVVAAAAAAANEAANDNAEPLTSDEPRPFDPDDPCQKLYLAQTAYCGETYADDRRYEICMKNAEINKFRCFNGLGPLPLVRTTAACPRLPSRSGRIGRPSSVPTHFLAPGRNPQEVGPTARHDAIECSWRGCSPTCARCAARPSERSGVSFSFRQSLASAGSRTE